MMVMATILALSLSSLAVESPATPTPPAPPAVALPQWLAGCWIASSSGADATETEECWTAPRGTMLLGSSHSYAGGRSGWFEHMRLVLEGGRLAFVAQPGGAPPTRFDAAEVSNVNGVETLIFRNIANDYPQRITYRYDPARPNEFSAHISLDDGSRVQSWTFRR